MNEEAHWDKIGAAYNEEIFDVYKSDRLNKLPRCFRQYANTKHTAIDFGCGTGKSFAYLAPLFKSIIAVDISAELLHIARQTPYKNIVFKKADLTQAKLNLPQADFAFCCNVAMLPDGDKNFALIKNIRKSLNANGTAVFVLPSLDSALYASWRLIEWYKKEKTPADKIPAEELNAFKAKKTDIIDGIVYIDKVPTRHYSASQIEVIFREAGFTVTTIEKMEYDWNTEFSEPPSWMNEPYPWDWLVECKVA
jgi:SAM-dependent methyltransferase